MEHKFHCRICGMCCRNIRRYKEEVYPILKKILGEGAIVFDLQERDGACINLTSDNRCAIYETRPLICNTEKMFKLLNETLGISMEELHRMQTLSCSVNRKTSNKMDEYPPIK